ncbi:MAG: hypothetical protein EAZ53_17075, partial [Bacteroidetes bacterium]
KQIVCNGLKMQNKQADFKIILLKTEFFHSLTFWGLAKVAIFTTKLHTKHQSSNLAKTVIRSTEPPLLPNPCYSQCFR